MRIIEKHWKQTVAFVLLVLEQDPCVITMCSTNPHQVCLHWHFHTSVYLPCSFFFYPKMNWNPNALVFTILNLPNIWLFNHWWVVAPFKRGPSKSTDSLSEINRTFAIGCWLFVDYLVCVKEHVRNDMAAMASVQLSRLSHVLMRFIYIFLKSFPTCGCLGALLLIWDWRAPSASDVHRKRVKHTVESDIMINMYSWT